MKPIPILFAVFCSVTVALTQARAAVGYVNYSFQSGDSLISNPLLTGDNALDTLFPAGPAGSVIPNGATISVWDQVTQSFRAPSIFDQVDGWSMNYELTPGFGALLHSPAPFAWTFVGEIPGFSGEMPVPRTPPPDGLWLLSSLTPYPVATFNQAIGRDPRDGEYVTRLDNATGTYSTTTYFGGAWDNGDPAVGIVGSAFFNLGPVAVPEPAITSLGLMVVGVACWLRRTSRRKS